MELLFRFLILIMSGDLTTGLTVFARVHVHRTVISAQMARHYY